MIDSLEQLKMQLQQAVRQLQQAEKAIDENELPLAQCYVFTAKNLIMKLGLKMT
ncbi:hypothetical protein [Actinobacillus equuli]|uniref:hypothetical protein n=1 Tax=Actinobacillus TaxID=713 RepID=UPI002442003E|nr:hypothetical protein [Actinobacillus equuli]WGE51160.1 hypothetical protein NYR68_01865 [Actinobacillus equuli subsp. haemolyticus]WGE65609.1 hypothetical protein NYR76_01220 [Actinobacillus equuli subsp. equuli]WGE83690.1 hypothetical protein NYR86_00880 [Actinobacillus equuli subsp. equuli]